MTTASKIWLIIAASLLLLGLIVFTLGMSAVNWDFTRLSTVKYETNSYEISEGFKNISIDVTTADVVFVPTDDANTSVVCYEQEKMKSSVSVKDGALTIETVDTRRWYEFISISFGKPKITVYLPKGEYGALKISLTTGSTEIPKELSFDSADLSTTTGDVILSSSVRGEMKIKSTTGEIHLSDVSVGSLDISITTGKLVASNTDCSGNVTLKLTTGYASLSDLTCASLSSTGQTGNADLKNVIASDSFFIERTTGSVTFTSCDAANIHVKVTTGNISGSLLSPKIFSASTTTGKVNLPASAEGGGCELITTTGNITITLQQQ